MLFTCIKSWFFRNPLASFHQISHWSFCWNVIDSLFKWSCSIDCQAHIFFFKTKNCSNDDIFISCDDRIGKMLHNICMSAVAMSLRWANRGPWASCFFLFWKIFLDSLGDSFNDLSNPMALEKYYQCFVCLHSSRWDVFSWYYVPPLLKGGGTYCFGDGSHWHRPRHRHKTSCLLCNLNILGIFWWYLVEK